MGLFDFGNQNPGLLGGGSDPKQAALMQAAFQLLAGSQKRGFLENIGTAGLSGLEGYGQAQQQQRQQKMQDFQFGQAQTDAQRRQAEWDYTQKLRSLPGQFIRPTMPPMNAEDPNAQSSAPQFDAQGYGNALMALDPMAAIQFQAATKKATPQPIKLGEGDQLLDPSTYKPVASNPKAAPDKTPEALRALQMIYGPNSPEYARAAQQYAQKLTTHQPGVSVSYGAPVAGIDARGNPVFFQPSKDGGAPSILSGVAPPKKDMPTSLLEKVASNEVALQKIDGALSMLETNPGALGAKNYLPDAMTQRLDPKGVPLRATLADIAGQKIHDRSGASVTVGESERLKPYIPQPTDTPEAARTKLQLFKREYTLMQQQLVNGAPLSQAAGRATAATPPASAASKTTNMNRLTPAEQAEMQQLQRFLNGGK